MDTRAEIETQTTESIAQKHCLAQGETVLPAGSTERQRLKQAFRADKQVQTEEALRRDLDLRAAVLDTIGSLVVILDREGRIVSFNRACEQLTGYSSAEVKGRRFWDFLLVPEEVEAVKAVFHQLSAGQFPNEHENYWVTKEGACRIIAWTNTALTDDTNTVVYVIGTGLDVTERRQAEADRERLLLQVDAERQRAEKLADTLSTIMENTHALIAYLDPQFNFLLVNSAYAQGSGHPASELLGRNHFDLFPNEENRAIFERVRDTGQPVRFEAKPFEYADQPKRGVTYWDWTLVPVKDQTGQVQGLVFSLLDVTVRKRAEQELQRALDESRQHQAEVTALLEGARAVLAHPDFETAVRAIFDTCKAVVGAQGGYVSLMNPDKTANNIVYMDTGGMDCAVDPELPMPVRGLREKAYRSNAAVYDNDFSRGEYVTLLPDKHVTLDNVLFAPLMLEGRAVGLLGLGNKEGGFTEDDARLATAFGELAAIALWNAQTQEWLAASEERFRLLAQHMRDAVFLYDMNRRLLYANPAFETLTGYSLDELKTQNFIAYMHPEDEPLMVGLWEDLYKGKGFSDVEFRILTRDGQTKWCSSSWSPVYDENGRQIGVQGREVDITERKHMEDALRQAHDQLELRVEERTHELAESELRFRQLAENVHEVFWIVDLDSRRILYVSPAYETIWRRSCQSLYEDPESFLCWVHPDDRARIADAVRRQGEQENNEECRIIWPDGTERWIHTRTFPIRDQAGRAYRVAGIAEDITEQMQAYHLLEQRVAERTRQLATLLEISRQVALTPDVQPLMRLILEQVHEALGCDGAIIYELEDEVLQALAYHGALSEDEMARLRISLGTAPIQRAVIASTMPILIPDLKADRTHTRQLRQASGRQFTALYGRARSWMAVPMMSKDRVLGVLEVQFHDVNPDLPRQAALAQAFASQAALALENQQLYEQMQALAAMEERQRLARDLHDAVSQTLFSACLIAEVLPRMWERDPAAGRRSLAELHALNRGALAEMRALLLELRPAALFEVSLDHLLRQLADASSGRAGIPIAVEARLDCDLPDDVHINLYRIAQEALNNVAKHSRATAAQVCLESSEHQVKLYIIDNGRGFDPDRVDRGSLGLNIIRERAAEIGADLTIESQPGLGTQIVVVWPPEDPIPATS